MKDTLSVYLHRKATAWYKRFPPIHSPDRAEDPRTPQVEGCDGVGGSPDDEEDFEDRLVASESSLDEADDDSTRACNEARSAQLFLALSDIAWYIAGAGCDITNRTQIHNFEMSVRIM